MVDLDAALGKCACFSVSCGNTRCMDGFFFSVGTLEVPAELLEGPSRLAALLQGAFKKLVRLLIGCQLVD